MITTGIRGDTYSVKEGSIGSEVNSANRHFTIGLAPFIVNRYRAGSIQSNSHSDQKIHNNKYSGKYRVSNYFVKLLPSVALKWSNDSMWVDWNYQSVKYGEPCTVSVCIVRKPPGDSTESTAKISRNTLLHGYYVQYSVSFETHYVNMNMLNRKAQMCWAHEANMLRRDLEGCLNELKQSAVLFGNFDPPATLQVYLNV